MNRMDRLPKERHDQRVGSIRSWKFHVVGKLVRGNALQYELAGISVLAFIAFKWNSKESDPDCDHKAENDYGQSPPGKTQKLVVALNLLNHGSCYSDEKRQVARMRRFKRPTLNVQYPISDS